MRNALLLAATLSFAAACLACYGCFAAIAKHNDNAFFICVAMLVAMLTCFLLFCHGVDRASVSYHAHKRRIRAMRKRLAFDRARHGVNI